jgi:hypothetical protein
MGFLILSCGTTDYDFTMQSNRLFYDKLFPTPQVREKVIGRNFFLIIQYRTGKIKILCENY